MPTWGGILEELQQSVQKSGSPDFDGVRRKYLVELSQHTGRDVILYAAKWTQPDPGIPPQLVSIIDEDLQGLMEVIHGLSRSNLDLVLHSPGGSPEAAEALMEYLRSKFDHIRVIVPQQAMSAATMMACAADVIVMGKHSFLGPIDPQLILSTPLGQRAVPAQAILKQFDRAQAECADPKKLASWLPSLNQYGPDLLVLCEEASALAEDVVRGWLEKYMFAGQAGAAARAADIAEWLNKHETFKSHSRHLKRSQLEECGLTIEHLETDQKTQDLVLSIFHAASHAFTATPVVKIMENQLGKAFMKMAAVPAQMVPKPPAAPQAKPPQQPSKTPSKQ